MRFAKLEGLGNDFLVSLDPELAAYVDPSVVRALADRRRGFGADGVIVLAPGDEMVLFNADGSSAEMSGNGLRCLGHLITEVRSLASTEVRTAVGPRRYERRRREGSTVIAATTMGPVRIVDESDDAVVVDVGNPHEVRVCSPAELDVVATATQGPEAQARYPDGINVEWAAPLGRHAVRLRVWERGVGETAACGTGSTAVAVALVARGLLDPGRIEVHNPGGTLVVEVGGAEPVLEGPSRLVGWVEASPEALVL